MIASFFLTSPALKLARNILIKKRIGIWHVCKMCKVGKTVCDQLASETLKADRRVSGIVTPVVFENGDKAGIDLVNIQTSECRRLGGNKNNQQICRKVGEMWAFNQIILDCSNEIKEEIKHADILVKDELRSLEHKSESGFQEGIKLLDQKSFHIGIVVIHPELPEPAFESWPQPAVININGVIK
ncbi:MAG: hypothetical protein JEZ06_11265 [Anaerolineaceae bacterium]|nr:hypothetical protein [Anaerolineaceae bacterium]